VFKWALVDKVRGRRRSPPRFAQVPQVPLDPAEVATPPAKGEPVRISWLGHSSFLVQLEGVSLLVDPLLRRHIFPRIPRNGEPPLPIERLPKIDATLVSHAHYDHLDLPSVKAAKARTIAGEGIGRILAGAVPEVTELGWWQATEVGPVKIHFVPSQHWSRRGLNDVNEALWGGFVIEGGGKRIYHSGDTAYFEGFRLIGERFCGIDAALLPIGAYDPAWFMEKQHMNPEQAIQAYVDLGARQMVAMHWGTFKLTDEPLLEPPERARADWARRGLPEKSLRILAIGEQLRI
jgi:L-ascorbate metabolism protein UlaG (beta-lactamase superfamily)